MIWSLLAFPAHAFSSIAPSYSSGLIQLSSWPSLTIHSKVNFPSLLFSYYLTLHCFHFSITLTTYYVFSYIHLFISHEVSQVTEITTFVKNNNNKYRACSTLEIQVITSDYLNVIEQREKYKTERRKYVYTLTHTHMNICICTYAHMHI